MSTSTFQRHPCIPQNLQSETRLQSLQRLLQFNATRVPAYAQPSADMSSPSPPPQSNLTPSSSPPPTLRCRSGNTKSTAPVTAASQRQQHRH
ncbi:Protein of unknown function [Pyronema omphalodes CBS 100304]|uniref:Uncharacterized protein n=1 Tax=Pyronema omphalodes (strain CBS 100304) TaxID=1076935 RepID=U4L1F0_PYROM|nr:Protein of unknown function [Pyronema omphalodes CBS 100304]